MLCVSKLEQREIFLAQLQTTSEGLNVTPTVNNRNGCQPALLPPALPASTPVLPGTDPNHFYVVDPIRYPETDSVQVMLRTLMGLRHDLLGTWRAHMTKHSPHGHLIPDSTALMRLQARPTEGSSRVQALTAVAARDVAAKQAQDKLAIQSS